MAFESGTAEVYPSAHVNTIQFSTEGSAPADCRMVASRTPVHCAVLIRFPPTSLLTHSRVTNSSTTDGSFAATRSRSCLYEYIIGVDTRPLTASRQASMDGWRAGSNTFFVTT